MRYAKLRITLALVGMILLNPGQALQAQHPASAPYIGSSKEYYYADGQVVTLSERPDWIAVATNQASSQAMRNLAVPGGVLAGTQSVQQLSPTLQIRSVASTKDSAPIEQLLSATKQAAGIAWVSPVFVAADGSWLVPNDELIIRLRPGAAPASLTSDPRFSHIRPLDGTDDQFVATLAAGGGREALVAARDLAHDSHMLWASPNFYQDRKQEFTPSDTLIGSQWHLNNTGQQSGTVDADADVFEAWDISAGGSSTITIAVIDDGMEYTHPDLSPNLFVNSGEIANNSIDDDGNGWVDDRNGWDFTTNQTSTPVGDKDPGADSTNDAHATAVAGVTAGRGNNAAGVAGVAYNARILPVRIFGSDGNSTTDANIASAIYYAAGRTRDGSGTWAAADILNNSWGGGAASTAIITALQWATSNGRGGRGTPAFFASGNDGQTSVSFPANIALVNPGVIAVGASNDDDQRSLYSNTGSMLDVVAPSNDTRSGHFGIVTVDRVGANGYNAGDYTTGGEFGGTSSATPLTAGIGALILSRDPNLTAAQVRGLLRNTTDLVGSLAYTNGRNNDYGYGRVNARTAIQSIGAAEVQVLNGATDVPNGGSITFSGNVNQTVTKTVRVRNQGTVALSLANLSVSGGAFSLVTGFSDTSLAIGEATTAVVAFTPTSGGASSGTMSFSTNDTNEAAFSITLSGNAVVPSITGVVFNDKDTNGARGVGEPGNAGWTIFLDQNNNGQYDPGSIDHIGEQVIPDNDLVGLRSTLNISGTQATISDLNVRLSISHSYDSDLQVDLIGPDGTVVHLIVGRGESGDDFTNTVLDDEAASSITTISAAGAPFTGSYRPEQPLSAFDGHTVSGLWTLNVRDGVSLDTGAVLSWSLIFSSSGEATALTDSTGTYTFSGLAAGTYHVRHLVQNGWRPVAPVSSEYVVTLPVGGSVSGKDFADTQAYHIYLAIVARP